MTPGGPAPAVGTELVLEVGAVAHGGHCVARHEGRVVFVRHALPGERVRARVTGSGGGGRYLRADAVVVEVASPERVPPPCPHSGPGRCGGCDWQHASMPEQRRLKTAVLHDALRRQGGLERIGGHPIAEVVEVVAVPGDQEGLRWRTRVSYAVAAGRVGLHRHRSHAVEPVDDCRIAVAGATGPWVGATGWPEPVTGVHVVAPATGDRLVATVPVPSPAQARRLARALPDGVGLVGAGARTWVRERAAGRDWRVSADGFWQVHPGAADTLVDAVRELLAPRPGEHLLDLYCGVGLFGGALAADLGEHGRVDAVESDPRAVADARRNLHDRAQVRLHRADVAEWLAGAAAPVTADLVVLDPTRRGAGEAVVRAVLARSPRAVAYVACDPVALARDLRTAVAAGWRVGAVRAYDLFPMTHHLEAVALVLPPPGDTDMAPGAQAPPT